MADTIALKKELRKHLAAADLKGNIDKIAIKKQLTLGIKKEEFYFILAQDFKNNVKIAKWLRKIGNRRYINDKLAAGDLFEQTYLICVGKDGCNPQVFDMDSIKKRGCSEIFKCAVGSTLNCKPIKSVIFEE